MTKTHQSELFHKLSAYQISQKISYHKVAILSNKSNEWALSGMTHGLRIPNILHISTLYSVHCGKSLLIVKKIQPILIPSKIIHV